MTIDRRTQFADWREEKAYPSTDGTTDLQWAWEFLRRNPAYIKVHSELDQRLSEFKRREQRIDQGLSDDQLNIAFAQINFGICQMIDPSATFEESLSHALIGPGWQSRITYGSADSECDQPRLFLPELTAAVTFSLAHNLDEQWRQAKKQLRRKISEFRGAGLLSASTTKSHRDNFTNYLRTLDAYEAKAKPGEIAKVILGLTKASSDDINTISHYKKAAESFRDNKYRFLLATFL